MEFSKYLRTRDLSDDVACPLDLAPVVEEPGRMAKEARPGRGCDGGDSDIVDRWFRALDQRRVRIGLHDWLLQVTSIYAEEDCVWIQIAEGFTQGGSVLLRVSSRTSVDNALQALAQRRQVRVAVHPAIIAAPATPTPHQESRTEIAALR